MPFHPLGIAVLGTLAVVSTGVAFKKVRIRQSAEQVLLAFTEARYAVLLRVGS